MNRILIGTAVGSVLLALIWTAFPRARDLQPKKSFCGVCRMTLEEESPEEPFLQEQHAEALDSEASSQMPIVGPLTDDDAEQAHDPPSDEIVLRKWGQVHSNNERSPAVRSVHRKYIRIVKEKIADFYDPPREVPQIGPVQLHHNHYKCTIYYTEITQDRSLAHQLAEVEALDVVYVDHNHFHAVRPNSLLSEEAKGRPYDATASAAENHASHRP